MRPLPAIVAASALSASVSATAASDFAPNPHQAFVGFVAINPPRADVPVGSLWINGFGPTGPGATQDNVETVRSLSNLTIDKDLQLSLSLGILDLLGIDPKARDHYTARFTDLSIVRVKDLSRLAGTKGEPRIIEALKAGTVTVSTDSDIGLSGQTLTQQWHVSGSTTNDRSRAYSIEARDMFIAIQVATPEVTQTKEQELRTASDGKSAAVDDFFIVVSANQCAPAPAICPPRFGVSKINTQTAAPAETVAAGADGRARVKLPVPISDGQGGLFEVIALRWVPSCSERKAGGCRGNPRLFAHYEGNRLTDMKVVEAKGW
jgi:hypothetical protein